jgi:hypothetical protein
MRYEFGLAAAVSKDVEAAFPELTVSESVRPAVSLVGEVLDAAQLGGILRRFENLGLSIVELRKLPEAQGSLAEEAE